jgi:hypothetical protein
MTIPSTTPGGSTLLCQPYFRVRPKRLWITRSTAVISRVSPRMESAATRDGGLVCAHHQLRPACSATQVDDDVPEREHLRLVAHHNLAERLHSSPARRQARQWARVSTVGIRVLRHTDYVRVGLANDRLAKKAIGRVRAFNNLCQKRKRTNSSDVPEGIAPGGVRRGITGRVLPTTTTQMRSGTRVRPNTRRPYSSIAYSGSIVR